MWQVSYWTLYQAEKEKDGSYFQLMSSLIFTAFTLEAYLNHIGKKIFTCWNDLERMSLQGKINLISEKLNVEKDDSKRPFQTVKKLFAFRNDVAHGKTIPLKIEEEKWIDTNNIDDFMHKEPLAEWEKYCTLNNAKRARVDVEAIMREFHKAAGITDEPLFPSEHWSGGLDIIN